MYNRQTASLRRPIVCVVSDIALLVEVEHFRLLRRVGVFVTREDAELASKLLASERSLRQHAVDGLLDHALWVLGQHGLERHEALVSHVAGVPEVALLFRFLAS